MSFLLKHLVYLICVFTSAQKTRLSTIIVGRGPSDLAGPSALPPPHVIQPHCHTAVPHTQMLGLPLQCI